MTTTKFTFTVSTILFKKSLERVAKIAPKKTMIPELRYIKLRLDNTYITLESTNLKNRAFDTLEVHESMGFSHQGFDAEILVPVSIIKTLKKEGHVQFVADLKVSKIELFLPGNIKANLQGRNAEDFPTYDMGDFERDGFYHRFDGSSAKRKEFLSSLKFGAHCSSDTDNTLQGFKGLFLIPSKDTVNTFSVDGNRLALGTIKHGFEAPENSNTFPVDSDSLKNIETWIKSISCDFSIAFHFMKGSRFLVFQAHHSNLYIKAAASGMMDFAEYIPEDIEADSQVYFRMKREELLEIFTDYKDVSSDFRCGFEVTSEDNALQLRFAAAPDESEIVVPLITLKERSNFSIHSFTRKHGGGNSGAYHSKNDKANDGNTYLNLHYMVDTLKTLDADFIEFGSQGYGMPVYIKSFEGSDTVVIMGLMLH
jgi:DNA polymerase III sliding clamp (beta) subunit (PCNA family)